MSAVELITTALAAGAGVGLKDSASAAVREAYEGLKQLLVRRVGDRNDEALRALADDEVEPDVWLARIGAVLTESGADNDEEVLAAAQRLIALVESENTRTFNINVGTNYGSVSGEQSGPVTFYQVPPIPPHRPEAD